jgi:hypothetical protein
MILQCLGQQFALNEASFFLIRLLQHYDSFELALDAQPKGSLPPAEWAHVKEGRSSVEKVWYQNSVTMYIRVRLHFQTILTALTEQVGWPLDQTSSRSVRLWGVLTHVGITHEYKKHFAQCIYIS